MVYEQRWALTVVENALERMRKRAKAAGKLEQFENLKPFLTGERPKHRYSEIARKLEMSEAAVKTAVHRLRRSYGEQLRAEIAETVASASEVNDELRHLLTTLESSRGGAG
jgi:RNA polymerase sigma-70 factor (ECF subfamily)